MNPTTSPRIWTIGELLNWTASFLKEKELESPRLDAEVLLAKTLDCCKIDLYGLRFAEVASDEVREQYRALIQQRLEGCPAAYLVGHKEFFSLQLEVSPAVLIPRPDSETLVTACLDTARDLYAPRILDIGTGSGNVAIALASQLPEAEVTAIDISDEALEIARRNAGTHDVGERIRFLHGDVFAPLAEGELFDIIVSNPPYIAQAELPHLPAGVRDYEPVIALDGGEDGFAIFDRLIDEAPRWLKSGGWLLIEIGAPQEVVGRNKIEAVGHYELGPTMFDHAGHPRVLAMKKQG